MVDGDSCITAYRFDGDQHHGHQGLAVVAIARDGFETTADAAAVLMRETRKMKVLMMVHHQIHD